MCVSPRTATHMVIRDWGCHPGGNYAVYITFFRFEEGVWQVFSTDTDNEYPGWSLASMHYRDFNKVLEQMTVIPPQLLREYS